MAYDEMLAQRIREVFFRLNVPFLEKKMFSGVCFLVDNKMCCGTHIDRSTQESLLLSRISEAEAIKAIELPFVLPMNFTGKPMRGYIYVCEEGIESLKGLNFWIQLCLNFNPSAKKSRK